MPKSFKVRRREDADQVLSDIFEKFNINESGEAEDLRGEILEKAFEVMVDGGYSATDATVNATEQAFRALVADFKQMERENAILDPEVEEPVTVDRGAI